MPSGPFKPAFGGKLLPVGCSDKTPRSQYCNEGKAEEPKYTTYSRTTAAIEQYWRDRAADAAAASPAPACSPLRSQRQPGNSLPGGEAALAHKTREACWRDSVQLGHQPDRYIPTCQGTPADIEEKEVLRTRGITGFTGKQPPPGCSKPPPTATDTSGWVAINAFDERRPRVKGIPGYTGHQPPSPDKMAAAAAAVAGKGSPSDQVFDHSTHAWISNPALAQPTSKAAGAAAAAGGQAATLQQGQQYNKHYRGQVACAGTAASDTAAAAAARSNVMSAGSTGSCQAVLLQAGQYQPWRGATAASEAPSTPYSPRFFMNGEELPVDCVPVPTSAQSRIQQLCQRGTPNGPVLAAAAGCGAHGSAANGCSGSSGVCGSCCACCCQRQAGGQPASSYPDSSNRQSPPAAVAGQAWDAQYAAAIGGRPVSAFSGLRRPRQTTYSAAYTPSAGFGQLLQQQMNSLQLHSGDGSRRGH